MKNLPTILAALLAIANTSVAQIPADRAQQPTEHAFNGSYTGPYIQHIAFPIGGIGAGMFCLEGTGAISHLSIRNNPDFFNEPPFFAALVVKGQPKTARVLEGPVPDWKKYGLREAGLGDPGRT